MDALSSAVEDYYDQNPLEEWERLGRHRTEFAVTLRALRDHLPPPPGSIIDIGGGPGRYAIELTQQGYQVTLVDISAGCLQFAVEKAAEEGITLHRVLRSNALDLCGVDEGSYDAVLLLGPLYHLLHQSERKQAVREGLRVLRPGGLAFAAFITRFAPFGFAARVDPAWILRDPAYARRVLETGIHDQSGGPWRAYFAHPEEVRPLMESCGLRTRLLVGCEGIASGREDRINELEGDAWQAWVDLNYELGQEPTLYGAAEHLLYVGEKDGGAGAPCPS